MNHPDLKEAILAQLEVKAVEYNLSGIERIRKIHVTNSAFTTANDLVTPTFKLKRFNAKQFFKKEIDLLYAEAI